MAHNEVQKFHIILIFFFLFSSCSDFYFSDSFFCLFVCLSLQARGTSRRIQNNAREGNVPPTLRAFAVFRKEKLEKSKVEGGVKLSATAISDQWKAMTHGQRKLYLDAAMMGVKSSKAASGSGATKGNDGDASSTSTSTSSSSSSSSSSSTSTSTSTSTSSTKGGKHAKSHKKGKSSNSRIQVDTPVLREIRRFDDVQELALIFGPASMVRVVSSMLTPSGRVKVKHFVRVPVLLKYDGRSNDLSIGFSVAAEFVRTSA